MGLLIEETHRKKKFHEILSTMMEKVWHLGTCLWCWQLWCDFLISQTSNMNLRTGHGFPQTEVGEASFEMPKIC